MLWNDVFWEADESQKILKLAYQFITEVKNGLFAANKYSEAESVSGFESLKKLENIVKLASIDLSVSSTKFDDDDMLLAASNIWIDLRNGSDVDPDPNILVSKALSVRYEPSASCPMFTNFLNQIFEENEELIRFVQKAVGYSLTGSVSEQCLFIMIGDGANGKSTFINVINQLIGRYGSTAAAQTMIANGRSAIGDDLVDLIGARLITVSETEEGQSLAEAKIKQMTGGDRLKGKPHMVSICSLVSLGKSGLQQIVYLKSTIQTLESGAG